MDQTLRHIAEQTAGLWLEYREGEVRADRLAGRKAASADVTLTARRHSDFEESLVSRAKASVLALRERLTTHHAELSRQVGELSRECDEDIGQRLQETREQRQAAMAHLEGTSGPRSAAWIRAGQTLDEAERAFRAVRAEVGGRPLRRSFVRVYWPLLAVLALAEVPVNRLAFELFFQEQPAVSLLLALVVGAVLMVFAHMVGTLLRRAETPQKAPAQIRRGLAVALLLTLAAALAYILASMRQLYVRLLETEGGGSLADQIQQLTQSGPARAIASVASENLGTAGWTLLLLNVALFSLGAFAAFFRHDPHPDYEKVWRDQERARRQVAKLRGRYERASGRQLRDVAQRLAALDALLRETQGRRDELATREAAVEPFRRETTQRIANTIRSRSLAFLEGAIAAIPEGAPAGSSSLLHAATEAEILDRLGGT